MSKALDRQVPVLFWIGDSGAAILMAAALACAVASAEQGGHGHLLLAVGGLIAAALLRGGLQIGAVHAGEGAAVRTRTNWRRRVFPHVLVAPPGDRRMLGEAVADAVDRIEDLGKALVGLLDDLLVR